MLAGAVLTRSLRFPQTVLKGHASVFRDVMEELVHGDLGVLEQQRLQDVLLSAPVTPDDDLHAQWERRLPALLDRRERHLQVRPGTASVALDRRRRSSASP